MMNNDIAQTAKNMRNRTTRLEREGDYWSEDEKEQLKEMFFDGIGITEIAIRLQRTEPAVIQQIEKMDLYGRKSHPIRARKCSLSSKAPACLCDDCQAAPTLCPRCESFSTLREGA